MPSQFANAFNSPTKRQLDAGRYENSLLQNEAARIPQTNRMQDNQIAAQDLSLRAGEQNLTTSRKDNALKLVSGAFSAAADNPAVWGQLSQNQTFRAAATELGIPLDQFNPQPGEDASGAFRAWAQATGGQAQGQFGKPYAGPGGSLLQAGPDGQINSIVGREPGIASQPRQLEAPVAVLGPDGRPVYTTREAAIGQTPYERPSGGLSARDATTARNKLSSIRLARQQIAEAREAFQPLKGSFSAGPMGQYVPTQAGSSFDAKVNTMRGTITGLKRVPGVGAMSDYETRLDQSMIPERGRYEATTEQQLNDLDTMLNYMEQGYSGLLEDGGSQLPEPQTTAQGGGNVAPEGTIIQSQDGRTMVKRNGQWVPQ